MKILFMGTPGFAVPSLRAIFNSAHMIVGVVTVPDKLKGRGLKLAESPVKLFAKENGLNILQPVKLKDESFANDIKNLDPDLIIVVAFRILPPEIFNLPKYGSINLHASLLPKYRGAAPINRAIINGEKETGVTTFFLKDKVDTGNIILQLPVEITEDDNAGSLHDKLMYSGSSVLLETINIIEAAGGKPEIKYQDETLASPAPKIFKETCKIKWNETAEKIYNLIRGLAPYPASFTLLNEKVIKIYRTTKTEMDINGEPGELLVKDKELFVNCSDKVLRIDEIQPEAKRAMNAKEYLAGHKFSGGERFMY